jgi:hypothetical protein
MKSEIEKMENRMGSFPYEQPILKKYGTMKEFTLGAGGSVGDGMGDSSRDPSFNTNNRGALSGADQIPNLNLGITDDNEDPVQRVNDAMRD